MSKIHIVYGPQGAGKSTYAKKLTDKVQGIHLSIDDWMWKLYGDDLPKPMNLKWIMERVARCENKIWELTKVISDRNCDVILDLGFTKREKRALFQKLIEDHNKNLQMHYVTAEHSIRRKRVFNRNIEKGETFSFEVTPEMFDFMEGEFNYPSERELRNAIVTETNSKE